MKKYEIDMNILEEPITIEASDFNVAVSRALAQAKKDHRFVNKVHTYITINVERVE